MVRLPFPGGGELLLSHGDVGFSRFFDLWIGDQHQRVGRCPPLQLGVPCLVDHFLQLLRRGVWQARALPRARRTGKIPGALALHRR